MGSLTMALNSLYCVSIANESPSRRREGDEAAAYKADTRVSFGTG